MSAGSLLDAAWEAAVFPMLSRHHRTRLQRRLAGRRPRIALVKQDCNEDLYCCEPGLPPLETIQSTLLRSGPAGLFTLFDTTFYLLRTEPDTECNIWKEKWDPLRWCPVEWFESFREHVPGRDYGQARFARSVEDIDWSSFDLVISIDVSVPARVTARYEGVVWAYYVREIKAPSWSSSLTAPISGEDLYFSQRFAPSVPASRPHVVDFPYHFQYFGLYHELRGLPRPAHDSTEGRRGVFLEYHTAREASAEQLRRLETFGPVYAHTVADDRIDAITGESIPACSMQPEALGALMRSKYHVKWGGRKVLGIAKVEAIAAGCLALSDPELDGSAFLLTPAVSANGFEAVLERLGALEASDSLYRRQVVRQRRLVDYLCCHRPANQLLDAWQAQRRIKTTNSKLRESYR